MTHHKLLTLFETPQERRQSTNVHGVRQNGHEVVQDPGDLAEQSPDVLGALGDLNVQQLLDSEREALLVGHHRDVVQTVEVGQRLQICPVLDELLGAAVQQSDVGVGAHNLLAIELQNQPQHAVGGGMLGAEVDGVVSDFALVDVVRLVLCHAHVLGVLGVDGAAEVLVGRHHARPLALLDLCIATQRRRRQAARNGSCREGCAELRAGGVQTQPLGGVAGQTRKGGGHRVFGSLCVPVGGLNGV
jgi:hypothetical protein